MHPTYNSTSVRKPSKLAHDCLKSATFLRDAGISTFPLQSQSKVPASHLLPWMPNGKGRRRSWKPYQYRLPSMRRLRQWFTVPRPLAVVCGRGLEVIDIDVKHDPQRKAKCEELLGQLRKEWRPFINVPIVQTPSGGVHIYLRCDEIEGNQVVARTGEGDTFIETRGEGGYVVAPFGPGERMGYFERGGIKLREMSYTDGGKITVEERAELFDILRSYDNYTPPKVERPSASVVGGDFHDDDPTRPGSIFNRTGSSDLIFDGTGWDLLYTDGAGNEYWRRPDKAEWGHSAVLYSDGVLIVYSTDGSVEPLEPHAIGGRGFSKFAAYALLQHGGNFSEAASALADRGFNDTEHYSYGHVDAEVAALADVTPHDAPQSPPSVDATTEPPAQHKAHTGRVGDEMTEYLWKGNHGRYLADDDRERRLETTERVLSFLPKDSYFTNYLRWVTPTTDSPLWFHVAASLSMAGHIINRNAWIDTGLDRQYPLFWIACLSESGSRKSTAINPTRKIIANDVHLGDTLLPDEFTSALFLKRIGVQYRDIGEDKPLPTKAEARLMCQEADQEGAFTGGVGYSHLSEIGTLLGILSRSHNDGMKAAITEWFECPNEKVKETMTQGNYYIYRPFLSILGASTVSWLVEGVKEAT